MKKYWWFSNTLFHTYEKAKKEKNATYQKPSLEFKSLKGIFYSKKIFENWKGEYERSDKGDKPFWRVSSSAFIFYSVMASFETSSTLSLWEL